MTSTRGDRRKMLRDKVLEVRRCLRPRASTPTPRAVRSSSASRGVRRSEAPRACPAPRTRICAAASVVAHAAERRPLHGRCCVEGRRRVCRARPAHAGRAAEARYVRLSARAAWRLDVKALLRAGERLSGVPASVRVGASLLDSRLLQVLTHRAYGTRMVVRGEHTLAHTAP